LKAAKPFDFSRKHGGSTVSGLRCLRRVAPPLLRMVKDRTRPGRQSLYGARVRHGGRFVWLHIKKVPCPRRPLVPAEEIIGAFAGRPHCPLHVLCGPRRALYQLPIRHSLADPSRLPKCTQPPDRPHNKYSIKLLTNTEKDTTCLERGPRRGA